MGQETSLPSITPGVNPTTNQAINQVLIEINRTLDNSIGLNNFPYFQTFVTGLRQKLSDIQTNIIDITNNNSTVSQAAAIISLQNSLGAIQGSITTLQSKIGESNYAELQTSISNLQSSIQSISSNLGSVNISSLASSIATNIANIIDLQTELQGKVSVTTSINNKPLNSNIVLTAADVGLGNVSNVTSVNLPINTLTQTALSTKVDKVNLSIGGTVGSASNVPVITYNTQGQITSASSVAIALSAGSVGLSNVKNVDTTNMSNVTLVGQFTASNQPIVTGDSGMTVAQKAQGQINNKINVFSGTINNLTSVASGGQVKDSGLKLDDSLLTSNNILSASKVKSLIDEAVSGVLDIQGTWDASNNLWPEEPNIKKGYYWYVSVGGLLGSKTVSTGDSFFATIDNPGQFESNWSVIDTNIGYVPENSANKTSGAITNSLVEYPSSYAVKTYVDAAVASTVLQSSDTTNYYRGDKTWQTLNASAVGLGNVTNNAQLKRAGNDYSTFSVSNAPTTGDLVLFESGTDGSKFVTTFNNLPISNATNTALELLVPKSRSINNKPLTGNIMLSAADVGLGNVSNVISDDLPVSNATSVALSAKVDKINLSSGGHIGSETSIPVITYNNQGQITSASSVAITMNSNSVGLGNVLNVDTTNLSNSNIQSIVIPVNAPISINDSGYDVAAKTQGQLNDMIHKVYPVTVGGVPLTSSDGSLYDSGKILDDSSNSGNSLLSASEVNNRVTASVMNRLNYRGQISAYLGAYPAVSSIKTGDLWIVSASGTIDYRYIMNGSAIIALSNSPGQNSANWAVLQGLYNFTPMTTDAQDKTSFTLNDFNYPTSSLVKSYVDTSISNIPTTGHAPIGSVIAFYGLIAPNGWLLCDGQTFNQITYPALHTLLGSNTVPDLRDYFIRGKSSSRSIGSTQTDSTKMPNNQFITSSAGDHTHTLSTNFGVGGSDAVGASSGTGTTIATSSAGAHTHTITGGDSETRPMNIALNYIIRAI